MPDSAIDELCKAQPEFELVAQLGEGSFGRVYLARQHALGGRLVALKVTSEEVGEAQFLARLLHTNIVPIYSTHRLGYCHAVCMPYLGSATLADLIRAFRKTGLPASGRHLVSTLQSHRQTPRSLGAGRGINALGDEWGESLAWAEVNLPILAPSTQASLAAYAQLSYVESVVWIAEQLADGLAHAHERGIIHRDLKPANILITDDGTPMLLDFNLAEDMRRGEFAQVGGTLPYSAPEVLRRLQDETATSEATGAQSDLYSLGLILFELLTGRLPGPMCVGQPTEFMQQLTASRSAPPPPLREVNPAVTPALESIVRHCLEPDPARRYKTARELQDDLKRQRENRPLRYAPDPSLSERAKKWTRRHPRLASVGLALLLTGVLGTALAAGLIGYRGWALRLDAEQALAHLGERAAQSQFCLAGHSNTEVKDSADQARAALEAYGVLDDPRWRERSSVKHLPADKRDRLEQMVGAMMLVTARGEAMRQAEAGSAEEAKQHHEAAVDLNRRAAEHGGQLKRAILTQRAALLSGHDDEASRRVRQEADKLEPRGALDAAMTGRDLVILGQHEQALPLLRDATRLAPEDSASWFLLGRCQEVLNHDRDAIASFTTALGLRPRNGVAHFRRGMAYLRCNDNRQAHDDFQTAVALGQCVADAHINSGLALQRLGRLNEAITEIDRAIAQNAPYSRVYFIRARFREQAGDRKGASEDRKAGLNLEPTDELSCVARGIARLGDDDRGALADFQKAIDLNARSLPGLLNAAHVLSDRLRQPKDALTYLDRAVSVHPSHLPARANRGLVLARLGQRDEAHREAQAVLAATSDPALIFQAGAIYAQTSTNEAKDQAEAFRLLKLALRRGHGHEVLASHPDLVPLRQTAEFARLVAAATGLR